MAGAASHALGEFCCCFAQPRLELFSSWSGDEDKALEERRISDRPAAARESVALSVDTASVCTILYSILIGNTAGRKRLRIHRHTHTHTHSESGAAYKGEVSGGVAGATVSFPQEEEEGAHLSGVVEATRAAAVAAVAKRRKETLSKAQWLTVQRARNPEKEYARRRRVAGLGLGISRAAEVHTGWTRDR